MLIHFDFFIVHIFLYLYGTSISSNLGTRLVLCAKKVGFINVNVLIQKSNSHHGNLPTQILT